MYEFKSALKEIQETQNKVILFMTILKALIVFLAAFLILGLFNFYTWGLSITMAMMYFAVTLHKEISTKTLVDLERKNPELAEKLRTAADHVNIVNYVVSRLHMHVISMLKNVKISTFIDIKQITYLILAVVVVSGAVLFANSNDLLIYDLKAGIESLSLTGDKDVLEGFVPNSLIEADVDIEDLNEDAQINEMALVAKKQKPKRDLYLPEDIFEQTDKSFEETLPKKKRIYIRKYFGEIRKYGIE